MGVTTEESAVWVRARLTRDAQIVAAVIVAYEYLFQMDSEVEYFWKKRWSLGKIIFLYNRIYTLVYTVSLAFVFAIEHPSATFCAKFFNYQGIGQSAQIITTHVMLELRLYVMYGSSKLVGVFLVMLLAGELLVWNLLRRSTFRDVITTNQLSPNVFICAQADPSGKPRVAIDILAGSVVELVLLGMAVWKAWQHRGERGLMNLLAWDAILYFIPIFGIFTAVGVVWLHDDITLNELLSGPAFAIGSIIINRLMISVRKAYYDQQERRATGVLPTVSELGFVVEPSSSGSTSGGEANIDVELFDDGEIQEERRSRPVSRYGTYGAGPSNWRRQSWMDTGTRGEDIGLRSYSERGGF